MPAAAHTEVKPIHKQPLPAPFEGWNAQFVEVTTSGSQGSDAHRHPGFVLGYVIEGNFRFALDQGPEKVLRSGEAFYEPPGALHRVSASADGKPTRILAVIISNERAA